jgi:hypothetical protein
MDAISQAKILSLLWEKPVSLRELRGFEKVVEFNQCRPFPRDLRELKAIERKTMINRCHCDEYSIFRGVTAISDLNLPIEGNFASRGEVTEWIEVFSAIRNGSLWAELRVPGVGSPLMEDREEEKKGRRASGRGKSGMDLCLNCRVSGSQSSRCSPGCHSGTQSS